MVQRLVSRVLIPVAAGALAVGVPVAVGASDGDEGQSVRHPVEFAADAATQAVISDELEGPDGRRVVGVSRSSTLSGDIVGTSFGASYVTGRQEVGLGAGGGVSIWTITDSPCGAGTVVVYVAGHGQLVGDNAGVWRIAAGAGTDDLANARGGGSLRTPVAGHSELIGNIRCS